jgi:hypothetical protein
MKNDIVLPIHFMRNKPIVRYDGLSGSGVVVPVLL